MVKVNGETNEQSIVDSNGIKSFFSIKSYSKPWAGSINEPVFFVPHGVFILLIRINTGSLIKCFVVIQFDEKTN